MTVQDTAAPMVTLAGIEAAAERIAPYIRATPLIEVACVRDRPVPNPLFLKLECLQVTGAFKTRGAMNRLLTADKADIARGIVTASGGNHGLAVARAGLIAGVPATVYLPTNASRAKIRALSGWGAQVCVTGSRWDEADRAAAEHAAREGAAYFHPFKDPAVVAGQGTLGLELVRDLPEADVYLVSIGGGGLIAGLSTVLRAKKPKARIIGVEPAGCPTLQASLAAGHVVTLDSVTTQVATMSCGRTDERIFEIVSRNVDEVVLVEDEDMAAAARWIWTEFSLRADLSAAAAIAALRRGLVRLGPQEVVCTLICGADDAAIDPVG
ncbi:threonine/serine dehydratase [Mangrovicoccus sp. HB161399]|uniref:threonine ammonia-lyase n=1 Tax=Mangrovicoccus sp. HB161399 TaxID=2720392 RepID=UPI001C13124E|nr:pyridoxal-phosphate dependent enzyme [Mangrovicoccus sp. HB161399]